MQITISDEEMKIIELFQQNVYGKSPDTTEFNQRHDGKAGHWLERQMGIEPPRDCRRLNFLREYDNENTKLYP